MRANSPVTRGSAGGDGRLRHVRRPGPPVTSWRCLSTGRLGGVAGLVTLAHRSNLRFPAARLPGAGRGPRSASRDRGSQTSRNPGRCRHACRADGHLPPGTGGPGESRHRLGRLMVGVGGPGSGFLVEPARGHAVSSPPRQGCGKVKRSCRWRAAGAQVLAHSLVCCIFCRSGGLRVASVTVRPVTVGVGGNATAGSGGAALPDQPAWCGNRPRGSVTMQNPVAVALMREGLAVARARAIRLGGGSRPG
jgi:hypothetical protein